MYVILNLNNYFNNEISNFQINNTFYTQFNTTINCLNNIFLLFILNLTLQ